MLKQRLLTAFFLLVLLVLWLFQSPIWLYELILIFIFLAASFEWCRLFYKPPATCSPLVMGLFILLQFALGALLHVYVLFPYALLVSLAVVVWGSAAVITYNWRHHSLGFQYSVSKAVAATSLLLINFFSFVLLRLSSGGAPLLLLGLGIVIMSDTIAYFTGRAVGHHRLIPQVSPKKTWEGCLGGFFGTLVMGTLFSVCLFKHSLASSLLVIALTAIAAVFGDLFISLLKRLVGVKDTGALLPGHGGLLDRLDAILMALPVFTYFALFVCDWG